MLLASLTNSFGRKALLNPEDVSSVVEDDESHSVVTMRNGKTHTILGTPGEVYDALKCAE